MNVENQLKDDLKQVSLGLVGENLIQNEFNNLG